MTMAGIRNIKDDISRGLSFSEALLEQLDFELSPDTKVGVGQNPVPPMTLKSLLKGGNHPQKGTLGFDPQPSPFGNVSCWTGSQ